MNWEDVHDPEKEFDFHLNWICIANSYGPDEIQAMINKEGVQQMVHIVNEHYWLVENRKPLLLTHIGGRKAVVER